MEKTIYNKILLAKSSIGKIIKDRSNEFGNFTYADLNRIFEKVNDVLTEIQILVDVISIKSNNEMSQIMNRPYFDFKVHIIDLENVSSFIEKDFTFPADDEGKKMKLIQATGSMITYATRYIYGAIFSIQFENDPDNGKVTQPGEKKTIPIDETLKQIDLTENILSKWNGKVYGDKVYIDKIKYTLTQEQLTELENNPKYIKN